MKLQIALTALVTALVVACGTERPDPNDYIKKGTTDTAPQTATGTKTDTKTADATKTPTNTMTNNTTATPAATPTPTPTPTPAATPAKVPARTVANATEIAAAKTSYGTDCGSCHRQLNDPMGSAKKGVTKDRLAAPAALNQPLHKTLLDTQKWPKDISTDDNVENEMLKASAMVEALK